MLAGMRDYTNGKFGGPLRNTNLFTQEMSLTVRGKIANWNLGISKWLRLCFYDKFSNIMGMSKNNSTLLTFIFSAFWHGFYPGYYVSFFLWQMLLKTERSTYKLRNEISKYIPLTIIKVMTVYFFNVIGMVFLSIQWGDLFKVFNQLKYWYLMLVFVWFGLRTWEKKYLKQLKKNDDSKDKNCLLYTSPSPRDLSTSRMPSSA